MGQKISVALAVSLFAATLPTVVNADMADKLDRYVGYTILESKTVKGWISDDGKKRGTDFSGCEYGRQIIFTDNTYVTCSSYGYAYAYYAKAIILVKRSSYIMIVGDDVYDIRN